VTVARLVQKLQSLRNLNVYYCGLNHTSGHIKPDHTLKLSTFRSCRNISSLHDFRVNFLYVFLKFLTCATSTKYNSSFLIKKIFDYITNHEKFYEILRLFCFYNLIRSKCSSKIFVPNPHYMFFHKSERLTSTRKRNDVQTYVHQGNMTEKRRHFVSLSNYGHTS
jgi:hypothetical protein